VVVAAGCHQQLPDISFTVLHTLVTSMLTHLLLLLLFLVR
jgi:hypothetical protein